MDTYRLRQILLAANLTATVQCWYKPLCLTQLNF